MGSAISSASVRAGVLVAICLRPILQISAYPHVLVEYVNAGIFPLS